MAQCVHERVHTCAVLCHTLQRTNTTLQVLNCCVVQKLQKSAMKEVETMWACLHANNWKCYDQFERLGPDDCICCICFAGMEPCFFLAHLIFVFVIIHWQSSQLQPHPLKLHLVVRKCFYSPLEVAFCGEKALLLDIKCRIIINWNVITCRNAGRTLKTRSGLLHLHCRDGTLVSS